MITGWFWIAVGSVLAGGVFSALYYSLTDLSKPVLEEISAKRNNPARDRHLEKILADLSGHAHAVALPRIVFNAMVAVALVMWVGAMRGGDADWVDVVVAVPGASLVVWVFGLVIPASVARHAGEQAVYSWAGMIRGIYLAVKPLSAVVAFFDEVVRRLAGQTKESEGEEIKEEVLSAVEEARQEGQFDEEEQRMIEAVVGFRELTVAQIMTPRTEVEGMELTNDLGKVTATIRKGGHSRIPVYEGTIDRIVGVFYVKDLMRWLAGEGSRGGKTFSLRQVVRPAHFVPETKTVRELLQELLEKRVHIAIVADEFGGTAGLVTFEDIVEEVFGEIQDEYEVPEDDLEGVKVDNAAGWAEMDAREYIKDVNSEMRGLSIEIPEGEDYDTVGGWVTVTQGRIPGKGETLTLAGVEGDVIVTVLEAEPTRVVKVRMEKPAKTASVMGVVVPAGEKVTGAAEE